MTPEEMERQALIAYLTRGGQLPQIPQTAGDEGTIYEPMPQQQQQTGYNVPPALQNSALLADVLTAGGVSEYQQGVSPIEHAGNTINRTLKMGADIGGELSLAYPTARSAQEFSQGNYGQGIREMAPHVMTAGTFGALPAARAIGSGISKAVPAVGRAADKAVDTVANMPGVSGFLARQAAGRVPNAAAAVGSVEGTKALIGSTAAMAEGERLPPLPQFDESDPASVNNLQDFLLQHGEDIGGALKDGRMGEMTRSAVQSYIVRLQRQREMDEQRAILEAEELKRKSSPEFLARQAMEEETERLSREAEARERLANSRRASVEADAQEAEIRNAESARRAQVLTDAEGRYANRATTASERITNTMQDAVGPVIMGASALMGGKGLGKVPFQRRSYGQIDDLASGMNPRRASDAQKRAYVRTYDDVAGGKIKGKDVGEAAGMYGVLGGEMYLSSVKLDKAEKDYAKALTAYEQYASSGQTDGGKEKELADAVAKYKAQVKKWEGLQGAGLHGMGYYTAGKGISAAASAASGRPNVNSQMLRNQFADETGYDAIAKANSVKSLPKSVQNLINRGGPAKKAVGAKPGDSLPKGNLTKRRKEAIAQGFADATEAGKKMNITQAEKLAPGVPRERVKDFLDKIKRAKENGMRPGAIVGSVKNGDIKSVAGLGLGAGAAAGAISSDQERQALVDYLRSGY